MGIMKKIFLITLLLSSCFGNNVIAQSFTDSLCYHFIIAFDKAGCPWISDYATTNAINKILFSRRADLLDRNSLFQDSDYISLLGFAIPTNAHDMSNYVFPLKYHSKPMTFQTYTIKELKSFIGSYKWENIVNGSVGDNLFSLVSVAKPYSLMALKSNHNINRTFIITITDHRYNGNDFYDELNAFQQFTRHRKQLMSDTICKHAYEVSQYYYIKYYETVKIGHKKYAELYEYIPLQRHLELSKIVDYPKQIDAVLCRDGSYQIEFNIQEGDHPLFKIEHMTALLGDTIIDMTGKLGGEIFFEKITNKDLDFLQLRAWVRMTDGVYNNTILSPSSNSPIEYGREGLNVSIPIKFEPTMKIYNFLTLAPWAWPIFFDSQSSAIMFWQITIPIIIVVLLLFTCWCIVRFTPPYTLQPGDFKLIDKK